MDPVFDSRSTADVLLAVAKSDPSMASRFPFARLPCVYRRRASVATSALKHVVAEGDDALGLRSQRAQPSARSETRRVAAPSADRVSTSCVAYQLADGGRWSRCQQAVVAGVAGSGHEDLLADCRGDARRDRVEGDRHVADGDLVTVKTAAGELTAPALIYLGHSSRHHRRRCSAAVRARLLVAMRFRR